MGLVTANLYANALTWGFNYFDTDKDYTNQIFTKTAPSLANWATENGPNARKWLGKAQEILGR